MTLLQISEKIRDHLIKQNAQSQLQGTCLYRSDNGCMCAVGALISDSAYTWELEKKGTRHHMVVDAISRSLKIVPDRDTQQVMRLWQEYHDSHLSGVTFLCSYRKWILAGSKADADDSPAAVHEYIKSLGQFDMSGEITKRYLKQVSLFIMEHLLKQGKASADLHGACKYRYEGAMCAAGCLISDEHYEGQHIEGVNIGADKVRRAIAASIDVDPVLLEYSTPLYTVIREWQIYHDGKNPTFSAAELDAKHVYIMLALDNTRAFPDLKD